MDKGKDFIDYLSLQSLKTTTKISIAIKLLKVQHSMGLFENAIIYSTGHKKKYRLGTFDFSCLKVLRKPVTDELFRLPLPTELKKEIVPYILPICRQLLDWLDQECFNLGYISFDYVRWTNEGTINVPETMKSIFDHHGEDEDVFISLSNACLEDRILKVWERIPEYMKNIDSIHNRRLCRELKYNYHLVIYWLCFCKDELSRLMGIIQTTDRNNIYNHDQSVYKNMFDLSIRISNSLAAAYFWQKLTEEEKNTNQMDWMDALIEHRASDYHNVYQKRNVVSDILYFMLSQMNNCEQQKEVFKKHSKVILKSLLFDWPWHQYLVETICVMFPFLEEEIYVDFMYTLVCETATDAGEEKLFNEVWCASPMNLKKCFVRNMVIYNWNSVFFYLLKVGDLNTLKQVLFYTTEKEKKDYILACVQGKHFISFAVNNLDLADSFLKETLDSEHDICYCKNLIKNLFKDPFYQCFLQECNEEDTKAFLRWCFDSEYEMHSFMKMISLPPDRQ